MMSSRRTITLFSSSFVFLADWNAAWWPEFAAADDTPALGFFCTGAALLILDCFGNFVVLEFDT